MPDVMRLLLEAAPGFRDQWRSHLAKCKQRGVFTDTGEFACYLLRMLEANLTTEFPAVFEVIERVIAEGDAEARMAATAGVLETVQTIASGRPFGPEPFVRWLGPRSLRAWQEIAAEWANKI
jgi:hypothetical protein